MARIAISNLAWTKSEDEQIFNAMRNLGVYDLEISPFRDVTTISELKKQFKGKITRLLNRYGIHVTALQSLMFGYPGVSLFKNESSRNELFEHLKGILEFSNQIGSKVVIFGSPKNKIRGSMSRIEALKIATKFFKQLAEQAKLYNIIFCIEPTPPIYGADFICNIQEAVDLIKAVGHESFKINLDVGASILNREKIEKIITNNIEYIGHVHISEPHLKAINLNYLFHKKIADALNNSNYNKIVSIEMLPSNELDVEGISEIISFVKNIYQ